MIRFSVHFKMNRCGCLCCIEFYSQNLKMLEWHEFIHIDQVQHINLSFEIIILAWCRSSSTFQLVIWNSNVELFKLLMYCFWRRLFEYLLFFYKFIEPLLFIRFNETKSKFQLTNGLDSLFKINYYYKILNQHRSNNIEFDATGVKYILALVKSTAGAKCLTYHIDLFWKIGAEYLAPVYY